MAILVGSARMDENGKLVNGKAGDQTGKEVATQTMYTHSKGWYIIRPKSVEHAAKIAERMLSACNNPNIGYDQNQRLGVITAGIDTNSPTECDCSSLVRQCVKEATRKDPGNFTTANETNALVNTGLFDKCISYVSQAKTPVYNGDVLVTKTKGHTVIVVSGSPRPDKAPAPTPTPTPAPAPSAPKAEQKYKVTASALNVRKGPGTSYGIATTVKKNEVYTIVEINGNWGKLKSGAGWVSLSYMQKV